MRLSSHDGNSPDPLMRPAFGNADRVRRLIWNVCHALLFRWTPAPCHGYRCALLRLFGAKIGDSNFIYPSARVWAPWLLETADVVTLGPHTEIYNPGGVRLGHHTIISQGAYLCGATHDYNKPSFDYVKKPITTEPYVWICARAIVLPGVHCAVGSVLGAGGVISRTMEPWTVYSGNPAAARGQRRKFEVNAAGQ